METEIGTVTKWLDDRGFGFIERDGSPGSKVFCHWSSIRVPGFKELKEGERVQFSMEETPKGFNAFDVFPLDDETAAAKGAQ